MVKDIEVLHIRIPTIMNHGVWFFFLGGGEEIRSDSIKVNTQGNSYILDSHFAKIVKIAGEKFDNILSKAQEALFHTVIFRGVLTQNP